jgi:hypothetical protein
MGKAPGGRSGTTTGLIVFKGELVFAIIVLKWLPAELSTPRFSSAVDSESEHVGQNRRERVAPDSLQHGGEAIDERGAETADREYPEQVQD